MSNPLTPADRKLLSAAACVAAVLITLTLLLGRGGSGEGAVVPSTYSSASGGAKAAFLLLQNLRFPVTRWEESPLRLDQRQGAVLVLADPNIDPEAAEAASLQRFVEGGGRVLFCGKSIGKFFPGSEVERWAVGREWREFSAQIPSLYTRAAAKISMEDRERWGPVQTSQLALYGDAGGAVVVAWRMGAGEVIWWAAPTPLTNAGVLKEGNLALLLNAVSRDDGGPLAVYWDEYFHGQRASLWSYVERTPVKWALWQAALFTGLALFAFSRRWGPVIPLEVRSRLSPLEFVDAVGALYERGKATGVPVQVAYKRLRLAMTARLLVPVSISNSELAQAGVRLGLDKDYLADLLDQGERGGQEKLPPTKALRLVRELDESFIQLTERK
jgi:Domain of unknown function (DUF4350)